MPGDKWTRCPSQEKELWMKRGEDVAAAAECNSGGRQEGPEKTRLLTATPVMIPSAESRVTPPGIEPGSPWREASSLTTTPPRTLLNFSVQYCGAAVVERLVFSPPTKANWAQSPAAGDSRIFTSRNRAGRCHWSASFPRGSRFPCPCIPALLAFGAFQLFPAENNLHGLKSGRASEAIVGKPSANSVKKHVQQASSSGNATELGSHRWFRVGPAQFALLFGIRLNFTVLYILEPASFLHWLPPRCEVTPFLIELHVIGAHNCEVFIYWRRVTWGVSNKVRPNHKGAAVAERLAHFPPTKANRVKYPVGSLPDFRTWELCWTMSLLGGFSRVSPVSPALSLRRCSILTSITLIRAFKTSLLRAAQISSLTHSLTLILWCNCTYKGMPHVPVLLTISCVRGGAASRGTFECHGPRLDTLAAGEQLHVLKCHSLYTSSGRFRFTCTSDITWQATRESLFFTGAQGRSRIPSHCEPSKSLSPACLRYARNVCAVRLFSNDDSKFSAATTGNKVIGAFRQ
ncbi:hypothetical protein PR048_002782 [Dryococelus australis]|uniref:Uncharacterized protein n=1 Tax=Dryococelus australis TaxID=614101 RepID=A0ABQ9IL62_9NEOP|nr:hypothetical protein PR048_002782 [Dryococelus australis]